MAESPVLASSMSWAGDEEAESYAKSLRYWGRSKHLLRVRSTYQEILASPVHRHNRFLHNIAIQMYGKCSCPSEARQVFDCMEQPNNYSWNMMIAAYAQNGYLWEAMDLLERYGHSDVVAWTTMVTAYAQHGRVEEARRTFDRMPRRNLVSWNSIMTGYVQNGQNTEAVEMFRAMEQDGLSLPPNVFTLAILFEAFGNLGDLQGGRLAHQRMVNFGVQIDDVACTTLICMYGRCGSPAEARLVFQERPQHGGDIILSTSMIAAYAQNGQLEDARAVFESMKCHDVVSKTQMLTAYAQSGKLEEARKMFDEMGVERNVVTWTAMIAGYAQNGKGRDALQLCRLMDLEGVQTERLTIISLLDACAAVAELSLAKMVHNVLTDADLVNLAMDVVVGTAMVKMYGKCGSPELAKSVFDSMCARNEMSWNTMMTIYAESGQPQEALYVLRSMSLEGVQPVSSSLSIALLTCTHAGLLDDARYYFGSLLVLNSRTSALGPEMYAAMIGLLAKAGRLADAEELLLTMPWVPESTTWMTLLNACKLHGDYDRGQHLGRSMIELDPSHSSAYIVLSNLYDESKLSQTSLCFVDR